MMNLFVWMTNNIVYIIVYVIVYVFISYYYFFYILYMEINALSDNDSIFSFDDQWIDDYIHENIDENIHENILDTITSDNLSEMIDISNNLCHTLSDTLCDSIKIYFLYVDKDEGNLNTMNSNVIKSIKSTYVTYHKSIKKSLILSLAKKYSMYENNPYILLNILKYENLFTSKDLEKIISHPLNTNDIFDMSNNNFLTVYKKLQDIDINQSTLKILYPLSCIYFIFIKTITKKKYNVIPSLKIPYHDQKKNRKTRYLGKSLSIQNKSKKYKKQL